MSKVFLTLGCGDLESQIKKAEESQGDCVGSNFFKFVELTNKFGIENFEMLEFHTERLSKHGHQDPISPTSDIIIHHIIHNTKLNLVMDFSNYRKIVVPYDDYFNQINIPPKRFISRSLKDLVDNTKLWLKCFDIDYEGDNWTNVIYAWYQYHHSLVDYFMNDCPDFDNEITKPNFDDAIFLMTIREGKFEFELWNEILRKVMKADPATLYRGNY